MGFARRGRRFRDAARGDGDAAPTPTPRRPSDALVGARASAGERAIVSSGHGDVDAMLGGGFALGGVAHVGGDDASASASRTFGGYFVAEGGATTGHRVCWVRRGGRAAATATVPRAGETTATAATTAATTAASASASDGLRIAWQYRRYLKAGRTLDDARVGRGSTATTARTSSSGTRKHLRAPDFCHAYDLTKPALEETTARFEFASFRSSDDDGGVRAWARSFEFIESFVRSLEDGEVGRVLVEPETPSDESEWIECAKFARALKGLTRDTNAVAVLIVPLGSAPPKWAALIRHVVDCAIDVQPLDGPTSEIEALLPDPHTCVGLVAVRKLQFDGALTPALTRMDRVYALQLRRKRMAIRPLQFRPEEDKKKKNDGGCAAVEGTGLDDF